MFWGRELRRLGAWTMFEAGTGETGTLVVLVPKAKGGFGS